MGVDWDAGVGVAGHSMGGEVVSQMASTEFAEKYNVKAAVCEHCLMCIKTGDIVSTPAMYMTGTLDYQVSPKKVKKAFSADTKTPKSYRNQKGKGHLEMLNLEVQYNSAVASHAAAFFNVWLKQDKDTFYNQVYGTGEDSFCGSDCMFAISSDGLLEVCDPVTSVHPERTHSATNVHQECTYSVIPNSFGITEYVHSWCTYSVIPNEFGSQR